MDAQSWTIRQQMRPPLRDTAENARASKPREAEFSPQPPADTVAYQPSVFEALASTRDRIRQRLDPAFGDARGREIVERRTRGLAGFTRNVQAACTPVATEVLPEIRELQVSAQRIL